MFNGTMSETSPTIVWFRDDLRTSDHPALAVAVDFELLLVCLYVLEEQGGRPLGAAAGWWLAGSLRALDRDLRQLGNRLVLRRGAAAHIVPALAVEIAAGAVHWNRRYDGGGMAVDQRVEDVLGRDRVATFQGNVLFEPGRSGKPARVFTPFWRRMRGGEEPRRPLPSPTRLHPPPPLEGEHLDDWRLEASHPDRTAGLHAAWKRGEAAARARLDVFLQSGLRSYASHRDRPDIEGTSRLSPHLRFGEVSPFQRWHAAKLAADRDERLRQAVEKFLSELGWREFSYQLLYEIPDLARRNLQPRFDQFACSGDAAALRAWRKGRTGYPIVDAGMRQLWLTGWMHNRVRMIVASFLVKQSADLIGARARPGFGTRWSTPTPPTTRRAGNGWPAAAPMPRPISVSSIRCCRGRSSIPRAAM